MNGKVEVWKEAARNARAERDNALAELRRYKEREKHFSGLLKVADGGQYRNDWGGAVERMVRERDGALAELRRLRERVELMATHHEQQVTACVAVQPRSEHRAIGRAFRELLAEHDAEKTEER